MRRRTTVLLIVGLLLGLLVLAPTATPFRVESTTSDAMAPTITAGDAYVTVPAEGVVEGDVVVFWAPEEGRFLTRSVLGVADRGFVLGTGADTAVEDTSGVNDGRSGAEGSRNTSADEPRVVPRSAIVAEVLTVGGSPAVLPGLGGVVSTLAAFRIVGLLLALLLVAGVVARRRLATRASGRRATIRVRTVVVPLLIVLFVTCVAITPLSATSYQLTYDAIETGESELPEGETVTRAVSLPVATPPLSQWTVDGEGTTVLNWTEREDAIDATLTVPPPEEAGGTVVAVRLFPYPAWVPAAPLRAAHDVHPILASLLGAVILVGPLAVLYRLFLDGTRPIARVRRR
jgi:hypothetical protein